MFEKARKICKENDIELSLIKDIFSDKMSIIWYTGNMISLKYKNKECIIAAVGDVSFSVKDKNNKILCLAENTTYSGVVEDDDVLAIIPSDEKLTEFNSSGLIEWHYNNWLEIFVYENENVIQHVTDSETTNFKEVFEDISYYIELLKS